MSFTLYARHGDVVGLDISDHVLRLVMLQRDRRHLHLAAASEIEVPEGVIVHGEIMRAPAAVELIKKLRHRSGRPVQHAHYAIACLPEPTSFLKLLSLPPSATGNLQQDILTEAAAHFPLSADETYLDWQVVSLSDPASAAAVQVLVAAAPRLTVDRYTEILQAAGLEPVVLELEPIAIGRAVLSENRDAPQKTVAVLDLGATRASFTIYNNFIPQFSVSLPIAGHDWTTAIAHGLQLDLDQAEEAKRRCGLDNPACDGAIRDLLTDSLKELELRLHEAIMYYEGHFSHRQALERILITGGGAHLSGLVPYLQEQLRLTVTKANPLANIDVGQVHLDPNHAVQYSTALGLARRALVKNII